MKIPETYTGYIYLWYDTRAKLFYVGGHFGQITDSYVCSSPTMLRAYRRRKETFRIRILEYTFGDTRDLRLREQRWLDMIHDKELLNSSNVKNGTHRYYNVKKNASGGNGVGTNKGKSHPAWNKGRNGAQNYGHSFKANVSEGMRKYWAKKKAVGLLDTVPTRPQT